MTDQHPNAAPPCGELSGFVNAGHPDFVCQRGAGHPPPHETMLAGGARMHWGLTTAFPDGADGEHVIDVAVEVAASCGRMDVPLGQVAAELRAGTTPAYVDPGMLAALIEALIASGHLHSAHKID